MIFYLIYSVSCYWFLRLKRFSLSLLFLASSIPGFRTSSGKDTLIYLHRHNEIHHNGIHYDYEPFFGILNYISTFVDDERLSWWLFNFIYGLILLSLTRFIANRVVNHKNLAICFLIIFSIDASFNGMRSGLMYVFIVSALMSRKKIFSFLSSVLGVLTHISALILFGLKLLRNRPIVFGIVLFSLYFLAYDYVHNIFLYNERLNSKLIRYSESKNLNIYSGLVDLFICSLLYLSYKGKWNYIFLVPFVILIHLFWLQNFYGVFRVYRLLLVFILYLIWTRGAIWRTGYVIASVLFIFNFLKQIVFTAGSEGGFIPFK